MWYSTVICIRLVKINCEYHAGSMCVCVCDVRFQASQLWFSEGLDRIIPPQKNQIQTWLDFWRILMMHHANERETVHTVLNGLLIGHLGPKLHRAKRRFIERLWELSWFPDSYLSSAKNWKCELLIAKLHQHKHFDFLGVLGGSNTKQSGFAPSCCRITVVSFDSTSQFQFSEYLTKRQFIIQSS